MKSLLGKAQSWKDESRTGPLSFAYDRTAREGKRVSPNRGRGQGWTSPCPSAKERGRLTHFSHRIEAQKEPKVKTTGRDNLWYLWAVEQGKLDSSGKVGALKRETAHKSSQTITVVEKMDTKVRTSEPFIPSQAGSIPPPTSSLSRVTAVLSTRDQSSKKLSLPILLDCGCSTNDAARKIGAGIDEAKIVMLYNASGENMRISGQSIIKVDIPSLTKTAFLNFLVTPDLPRIEQVMVGLHALETLCLIPRDWPRNLRFDVEEIEVESEARSPAENSKKETSIKMSNHVKTTQNNVPWVRVLPLSNRPV
jgi:hypothetical protein